MFWFVCYLSRPRNREYGTIWGQEGVCLAGAAVSDWGQGLGGVCLSGNWSTHLITPRAGWALPPNISCRQHPRPLSPALSYIPPAPSPAQKPRVAQWKITHTLTHPWAAQKGRDPHSNKMPNIFFSSVSWNLLCSPRLKQRQEMEAKGRRGHVRGIRYFLFCWYPRNGTVFVCEGALFSRGSLVDYFSI